MFNSRTITLNIESSDIRLLVTQGRKVEAWDSIALEPNLVKEGLIIDPVTVSKSIHQLFAKHNVKGKNTLAALSGFQSIQRLLNIPKMSHKLTEEAIKRQADKIMPVPLDQLYLSWQTQLIDGSSQQIFLLGIPRNMLDAEVQCFHHISLTPRMMDLKPLALARMVNCNEAVILDIEIESCDLIVISDGYPSIMRSITTRRDYALSKRVQYIAEEFTRTLQFYSVNNPDKPLGKDTPLFLTGALAEDTEIRQLVSAATGNKIEVLTPSLEYPPDLPLAKYAINIGLALKPILKSGKSSIPNINILPPIYTPHKPSLQQIMLVPGIVAGIALIYPLYQITDVASSNVYHSQIEYNALEQQVQLVQTTNREAEQLKATIIQLQNETNTAAAKIQQQIQEIEADYTARGYDPSSACADLHLVLLDNVPAGVSIKAITLNKDGGSIQGEADNYEHALEYALNLRETGNFSTVWISPLSGEDIISFSITLGSSKSR